MHSTTSAALSLDYENKLISNSARSTARNYAPIDPRIAALPTAGTNATFARRQLRRAEAAKPTIPTDSDYLPKTITNDMVEKKARKDEAREGYKSRRPFGSRLSPLLDLSFKMEISWSQRLLEYSRKHKCPCGRIFNVLDLVSIEGKPAAIRPKCDHEREKILHKLPKRCGNCGRSDIYAVLRKSNHDTIEFCKRCKFTTYSLMHPDLTDRKSVV